MESVVGEGSEDVCIVLRIIMVGIRYVFHTGNQPIILMLSVSEVVDMDW